LTLGGLFVINNLPTNRVLLEKKSPGFERKKLTAENRFVIKIDFAAQLSTPRILQLHKVVRL
jgi:hypothetical protein